MYKSFSVSIALVLVTTMYSWTVGAQERQRVRSAPVKNSELKHVEVGGSIRIRGDALTNRSGPIKYDLGDGTRLEIPVFKVTPGEPAHQYKESDLKMIQRIAPAAKPLAPKHKTEILKWVTRKPPSGAGNVQNTPDPKITTLKLSARNSFHGLGWLEFNELRHIDAKADYAMWYQPNSGMGYMKAHLKVEKGEKYLVDWNVSCSGTREFHYSSTGGNQHTKLSGGSHHLLAIIEPQSSGWTSLMLWADVEWSFRGVEISKM
jgi:hypothetical protein